MSTPILSICIPSYNRPNELNNLLASVDCTSVDIEIIICEDFAPRRSEVRDVVTAFKSSSPYIINYYENLTNYGFDGNLRQLVKYASGEYIMFMGDDDLLIHGALNQFIAFLKQNRDKSYILRSYLTKHSNGQIEYFRYLPKTTPLSKGETTVGWLFKRSVTISGFTISRTEALKYATSDLDGTLLYQVYLMAQVCLRNDSIYCEIVVANAVQTFREDKPIFGTSEAEKSRYTPGRVSEDNSINFTKAYLEVTDYIDQKNCTGLTQLVKKDLSKYSYPFLSIQRKRGARDFLRYAKRLETEVGFGLTAYFYLYKWGLLILGENLCDRMIIFIKKRIGYTPNF